jgi:type I restriction enzyme S subunit
VELRAGYKRTEVGVIPEDWTVGTLAAHAAFITKGSTPTTYGFRWEASGVLFLRSECVSEQGLELGQSMYISEAAHSMLRRSEVRDGDILMTITGNVGRVVWLSGISSANINQHIARVRIATKEVEPLYVYHFLSQPSVRRTFASITTGQAYPQISLEQVRAASLSLPPLREQRAIASALSDVDALLDGLTRIIAKKRDLKQAAMQQLLTGQTRLPGFAGEWEVKLLGEVASMQSGGTPLSSVKQFYGGSIPWVSIGDMTSGNKILNRTERTLTELGLRNSAAKTFPAGSILYAMYASIGECCIAGISLCTSQAILGIQPSEQLDGGFLYYFLSSQREAVKALGQQGTQSNLNKQMVQEILLALPTVDEQGAIVEVLSDLDTELTALEARREKTVALKQAMMQELLTGRTRLV